MTLEQKRLERRVVPGPALSYVACASPAPRCAVGIVHGYADHAARYEHVQEAWAAKGIASVAIDLRGHGRADGRRGYCSRFEEYLDDVGELVRLLRDHAPGAPAFLFGHSFGGLVASRSVIADPAPWKGLILSSPFFGVGMKIPRAKVIAAKVASVVMPRLAIPSGLSAAGLTHDTAKVRAYEEDPLVFKTATARWFVETQRAQAVALSGARGLSLPLLEIFGEADPIVSFDAGRAFFDAAGSKDKTFRPMPGLLHETLNEPEWRGIADEIADWTLARA